MVLWVNLWGFEHIGYSAHNLSGTWVYMVAILLSLQLKALADFLLVVQNIHFPILLTIDVGSRAVNKLVNYRVVLRLFWFLVCGQVVSRF
jgi:hypothetical protein